MWEGRWANSVSAPGGGTGSVYVMREGLKASWAVGRVMVRIGVTLVGGELFDAGRQRVSHENDTRED